MPTVCGDMLTATASRDIKMMLLARVFVEGMLMLQQTHTLHLWVYTCCMHTVYQKHASTVGGDMPAAKNNQDAQESST